MKDQPKSISKSGGAEHDRVYPGRCIDDQYTPRQRMAGLGRGEWPQPQRARPRVLPNELWIHTNDSVRWTIASSRDPYSHIL
jgi:hypothetical protein